MSLQKVSHRLIGGVADKADFKANIREFDPARGKFASTMCRRKCKYCFPLGCQKRFGKCTKVSYGSGLYEISCDLSVRGGCEQSTSWLYKKLTPNSIVQFPSSGDISLETVPTACDFIENVVKCNGTILLHSKMDSDVAKAMVKRLKLDGSHKSRLLFQITCTTLDNNLMEAIEVDAPSFFERISAMGILLRAGFTVNVSCTPCLSPDFEDLYHTIERYYNGTFSIGVTNMHPNALFSSIHGKGSHKEEIASGSRCGIWLRNYKSMFTSEWAKGAIDFYKRHDNVICERNIWKLAGVDEYELSRERTRDIVRDKIGGSNVCT